MREPLIIDESYRIVPFVMLRAPCGITVQLCKRATFILDERDYHFKTQGLND